MKFLFTVHQFFPEFSAGTEVLTLSVAQELRSRGHEVRILTGHPSLLPVSKPDCFDNYVFDGLPVYRFHHTYTPTPTEPSSVALGYDNQAAADYFDHILGDYSPDVVHFFHLNRLGTKLIERAVQAGIPAFMSPTDFWLVCTTATLLLENGTTCSGPSAHAGNCVKHFAATAKAGRGSLAGKIISILPVAWLDTLAHMTERNQLPTYPRSLEVGAMAQRLGTNVRRLNTLTKIVVPTEVMRSALEQSGVAPERIAKLAYGVAGIDRSPRDYLADPGRPLNIGFIGSMIKHKGVHILLDAFRQIPAGQARLTLYGDPQDSPEYSAPLIHSAKSLPAVEFKGTFPNAEISAVLASFDVLVVPSLWHENTPLVIHSALAAGCPVVASDVPGIAELIEHRRNGLLFTPGAAPALAAHLRELIDQRDTLQALSDQCQPVQTMAGYVDAMLSHWTAAPRLAASV
jgi:glycosyltransferase involved in cell wall biosynthesis